MKMCVCRKMCVSCIVAYDAVHLLRDLMIFAGESEHFLDKSHKEIDFFQKRFQFSCLIYFGARTK